MSIELVSDYKEALTWYSTHASATAVSMMVAWASSDAIQAAISAQAMKLIIGSVVVAGFVGRII